MPADKQILPQHMHELRADLSAWLADHRPWGGRHAWASMWNNAGVYGEWTAAGNWAASLKAASLTYASTDMTRLALAAGDALDEYLLPPNDVPSPHGFLYFAEPITQSVKLESVTGSSIVACTWALSGGVVNLVWWSPRQEWLTDYCSPKPRNRVPALDPETIKATKRLFPHRIVPIGTSLLPLQTRSTDWPPVKSDFLGPGNSLDNIHEATIGARRLQTAEKTLVAAWKLMRQQLVTETQCHAPKAAVKRLGRMDPSMLSTVRYVQLRHRHNAPQQTGTADGPKREYANRHIVTGHWRTLARDTPQERDVWVRWHFRGPEGAPILDPSKLVQVLRR